MRRTIGLGGLREEEGKEGEWSLLVAFLMAVAQHPTRSNRGREEGCVSAHGARAIWSIMAGRHGGGRERQLAASHLRAGSRMKAGAQLRSGSFLFGLRSQSMLWYHPQLGWSSHLSQEEETRNSLTDTPRGLPRVCRGILDPAKLMICISHHGAWTSATIVGSS